MNKILAIIPARGGSKSVPGKNIRELAGKPLIKYAIETALAVRHLFHRIIVSTEDVNIANIAKDCGADVPFLRPAELAEDHVPTLPLIQHAVRFVETNDRIKLNWILLLQPTSPLRTSKDIEAAIKLSSENDCDSVISVVQVIAGHPISMKKIENNRLVPYCIEEKEGTRRQDFHPHAYMRNGAIYLSRRDIVMERNSIWGDIIQPYVMPPERSVNIDSELDLKLAEVLIAEKSKIQ